MPRSGTQHFLHFFIFIFVKENGMKKTWIALLLLPALLLAACGGAAAQTQEKTESPEESAETVESSLYVKKVEDLPEDFILGMGR